MKTLFAAAIFLAVAPAWSAPRTVTLSVPGMTCATCPMTVKAALGKVKGVSEVRSDVARRETTVTFDDAKADVAALSRATAAAGYPSSVAHAAR